MTTETVTLRDVLDAQASAFERLGAPQPMQRVILKHGVGGMGSPHNFKMGKPGNCFENAAIAACINNRHELEYCEGYGFRHSLGIPIHHAWLMTPDGRVIDVTWKDSTDCEYLGIRFKDADLRRWLLKGEVYGLLDTGRGINLDLLHEIDPEIVGALPERRRHARA
jgi:hypothetical protein